MVLNIQFYLKHLHSIHTHTYIYKYIHNKYFKVKFQKHSILFDRIKCVNS